MNWSRAEIKTQAKRYISQGYWLTFLASLLIAITGDIHQVVLVSFVIRVFVGFPLEVGGRKYFVQLFEGKNDLGLVGFGFQNNSYYNIVVTMFLRWLYVVLWALLLVIPGMVKMYAYRMVPYILADNPNIGHDRALELSNHMTRGEKWDIFVLDLSFLGWYLLGVLALGIGVLFVQPYFDATNAQLYLILREKAIQRGVTTYNELSL
ncbi:MAG: DUF975 family protein [Spirochaetota bacterium]